MWILLVSVYLTEPILGQTQSLGIIQAPQQNYEQCLTNRDKVHREWLMDGYRVRARCLQIKRYGP